MKRKADFIFIGILGLLMANTIVQSIWQGNLLSINNYAGFALWAIAIILRFTKNRYRRFGLAALLLLGVLNITNLTIGSISLNAAYGDVESPEINPLMLLLLIIYLLINKTEVKKTFNGIFFPNAEEQQQDQQRQIDFYYRKFDACSKEELEKIIDNFGQYPVPAQLALDKLRHKIQ